MSEELGRVIKWNKSATPIAGLTDIQFTHNSESVDVTTMDDDGIRKLLAEAAEISTDISVSGIAKDYVLQDLFFDNGVSQQYEDMDFEWASGRKIAGNMNLTNISYGAPYKDKITFTASLQMSGDIVLTKAV